MTAQKSDSASPRHELSFMDAHDQATLIKRGEITPIDLTEHAIGRIEALDTTLSAISYKAFDAARENAGRIDLSQPMSGVPCLVKDSLPYKGMPSACGSRFFADVAADTWQHPLADRIDDAGLIVLGKSTVPEFSLLPTTESSLLGATRNPWDPTRSAGGSSGGSAVAVAAGMVPLAHAADGGGSIRIPASCCGIVGFKPSRGACVRARDFHPLEDILVSDGLLARSVRDAAWSARMLRPHAMTRRDAPGSLRIAVCITDTTGTAPHPDVADVIEKTAKLCEDLGHIVRPLDRFPDGIAATLPAFTTLWKFLAYSGFEHCRNTAPGKDIALFEDWMRGLAADAARLDPVDLANAYVAIGDIVHTMNRFHEEFDILLTPVVNDPPPPLGHLAPWRDYEALEADMFAYIGYTPLQNIAGQPSISLPLFTTPEGLPVGSMFSAASGNDELLLSLAAALEHALPWQARRPALAA